MAKGGKVHHWRHGWIPISPEAKAYVAGRGPRPGSDVVGRSAAVLDRPGLSAMDAYESEASHYGVKLADTEKINGPHSLRDDVISANPNFAPGSEYSTNCVHCVNAEELRRRGYQVVATPLPRDMWRQSGRSAKAALISNWRTPTNGVRDFTDSSAVGARNIAAGWPDGARGWVTVNWKNGLGSHIFAVEKENGQVHFVDPQRGRVSDVDKYFDRAQPVVSIVRVDDLRPVDNVMQFAIEPRARERLINTRNKANSGFAGHGIS